MQLYKTIEKPAERWTKCSEIYITTGQCKQIIRHFISPPSKNPHTRVHRSIYSLTRWDRGAGGHFGHNHIYFTSGESMLVPPPPRSPPSRSSIVVRLCVGTSGPSQETSAPRPRSGWVLSGTRVGPGDAGGNTEEGIRGNSRGPALRRPPPRPPHPGRCCKPPPRGCTADCRGCSHRAAWIGLVLMGIVG